MILHRVVNQKFRALRTGRGLVDIHGYRCCSDRIDACSRRLVCGGRKQIDGSIGILTGKPNQNLIGGQSRHSQISLFKEDVSILVFQFEQGRFDLGRVTSRFHRDRNEIGRTCIFHSVDFVSIFELHVIRTSNHGTTNG